MLTCLANCNSLENLTCSFHHFCDYLLVILKSWHVRSMLIVWNKVIKPSDIWFWHQAVFSLIQIKAGRIGLTISGLVRLIQSEDIFMSTWASLLSQSRFLVQYTRIKIWHLAVGILFLAISLCIISSHLLISEDIYLMTLPVLFFTKTLLVERAWYRNYSMTAWCMWILWDDFP